MAMLLLLLVVLLLLPLPLLLLLLLVDVVLLDDDDVVVPDVLLLALLLPIPLLLPPPLDPLGLALVPLCVWVHSLSTAALAEAIELASFASRWPDNNFNNPASMACRLILIASIFASFWKMMSASTLRRRAV